MTVRIPRRRFQPRPILPALGMVLALASAPALASAGETPGSASPNASTEPRACPAQPSGTVDAGPEILRLRDELALRTPPSPDGEGEMLNSRGYNYGDAGGAVVLPAARDVEAETSR